MEQAVKDTKDETNKVLYQLAGNSNGRAIIARLEKAISDTQADNKITTTITDNVTKLQETLNALPGDPANVGSALCIVYDTVAGLSDKIRNIVCKAKLDETLFLKALNVELRDPTEAPTLLGHPIGMALLKFAAEAFKEFSWYPYASVAKSIEALMSEAAQIAAIAKLDTDEEAIAYIKRFVAFVNMKAEIPLSVTNADVYKAALGKVNSLKEWTHASHAQAPIVLQSVKVYVDTLDAKVVPLKELMQKVNLSLDNVDNVLSEGFAVLFEDHDRVVQLKEAMALTEALGGYGKAARLRIYFLHCLAQAVGGASKLNAERLKATTLLEKNINDKHAQLLVGVSNHVRKLKDINSDVDKLFVKPADGFAFDWGTLDNWALMPDPQSLCYKVVMKLGSFVDSVIGEWTGINKATVSKVSAMVPPPVTWNADTLLQPNNDAQRKLFLENPHLAQ